jgi:hypothetical protein
VHLWCYSTLPRFWSYETFTCHTVYGIFSPGGSVAAILRLSGLFASISGVELDFFQLSHCRIDTSVHFIHDDCRGTGSTLSPTSFQPCWGEGWTYGYHAYNSVPLQSSRCKCNHQVLERERRWKPSRPYIL